MMSTLPSCMDRYMNRYMVPATPTHHHVPQPPVGQPYFHQTATVANGAAGVAASTAIVPPPNPQANNTGGGAFMMNCYQNANGWTGVPLISTASRRPRKQQQQQQQHHQMPPSSNKPPPPPTQQTTNNNTQNVDFDETAMSRLAIHAHGAPLILANRGYRKPPLVRHPQPPSTVVMQKVPQQCFVATQRLDDFGGNIYENGNRQLLQPATTPHDTFSMVNSDESSSTSSSNSHTPDTCLPRIIKPRKRRKKERKPNACQNPNVPLHGAGKNNCPNANNGVSLMKSLPLVTSTATQTTTIHEMVEKNSTNVMSMMSAQDEPQFAGDAAEGTRGGDEVIEEMSSCSCRLCDPFCRIWAFPLRRSCSDNSGEVEATRRNVGVIGSHIKSSSARNEWRSTPQLCNQQQQQQQQVYGHTIDGSRKGSLSDSGDSGCDLLSGLHFATDDLLNIVDCGVNGAKSTPPPSNSDNSVCDFLLTDNCWEILSRRVMESLDLRSDDDEQPHSPLGGGTAPSTAAKVPAISDCVSSDSGSVFSDSVFSDGIPECYTTPSTNYQHTNTQDLHLGVQIANLLLDQPQLPVFSDCFTAQQFIGGANSPQRSKAPGVNMFGTPLYLQEKDRGNEILSCIDMVWNGTPQLMPVEE